MQLLRTESNPASTEADCARAVLDAVPIMMAAIRFQMRRHRSELTVPQFRTLYFVSSAAGHSLSDVADFIGLSLPAMSRLVDGLVEKRLLIRKTCDNDRRHVRLSMTPLGEETLFAARLLAQEHIAELIRALKPEQREKVHEVMLTLRGVFAPGLPASTPEVRGCKAGRTG